MAAVCGTDSWENDMEVASMSSSQSSPSALEDSVSRSNAIQMECDVSNNQCILEVYSDSESESFASVNLKGEECQDTEANDSDNDTDIEFVAEILPYTHRPKRMPSVGDRRRFLEACDRGEILVVRRMLGWGGCALRDCRSQGFSNMTGLHIAVNNGHCDIVEFLLKECGAPTSIKDRSCRYTPLHLARKNLEMTQLLIKYGADPNAQSKWGSTPLHMGGITRDVSKYLVDSCKAEPIRNQMGRLPATY